MSHINLIWAQAHGRVIGQNGVMPWHLPEDLAHFKRTTQGHPVIMGRRTWQSIPEKFRPLPGRLNVVISRDAAWSNNLLASHAHATAASLQVHASLHEALNALAQHDQIWVIGGAQIYAQTLPLARRVVMTQIDAQFPGDAFAPELGSQWIETARHQHVSAQGLRLAFVTYDKAP